MKRAPPRSAPPVGREEMLMIKKKVAPPKGPPPTSSLEGFRPKSLASSSSSRDRDDDYRGGSHSSRGGGQHRSGNRSPSSRYDYDDDEEEDNWKSHNTSTRHEAWGEEEIEVERGEHRNWEDRKGKRNGHWDRDDSKERDERRDQWEREDRRDRDEKQFHDEDRSSERRKPTNKFADEKAHDSDYDDDKETKTEKSTDKDSQSLRVARNGRDKIFNFRTHVLNANYKQLRTFVKTPCEAGVVIRCYIERSRSIGKNYLTPSYSLCADMEDGSGKELIVCRKMFKSKTAHYIFSMRESDLYRKRHERSRVYLGKLRSVSPQEYVMYDSGASLRKDTIRPDDIRTMEELDESGDENDEHFEHEYHKEHANPAAEDSLYKSQLCSIFYHSKTRPSSGLGMEVCVPFVPSKTNPVLGDLRTDLSECFKVIREEGQQNELFAKKCFIMQEKKSKYDPLSSCLVDFQGRANTASVKNFQLLESTPFRLGERKPADKASDDDIIFQLGKISEDCFNMDFMYPLSMLQAFAIAISRFDAKISW